MPPRLPAASAPFPLRLVRAVRLALHLVAGIALLTLVFPPAPPARRLAMRRRWSARLVAMLGVRIRIEGEPPPAGSLVVANHVSWLDVFVLNAACPAAFVAKAEVRQWPLLGWMASRNDTVFLRRGSRGHAKLVHGEIAERLAAGEPVALFPEGTTSDGSQVLGFHAALLQAAVDTGCPVQPAAISYLGPDGRRSFAAAYAGDTSLAQSLGAILAARGLTARLRFAPRLCAVDMPDRKALTQAARAAIVAGCEVA